jgi:lysophospholipase L1-like esterase
VSKQRMSTKALCGFCLIISMGGAAQVFGQHWVGTWEGSPAPGGTQQFENQTLREIVHTSIGGDAARIRISNAFGTEPLVVGAAHLALHASGSSIQPASDHAVTFGGSGSITIPRGALALSDPVKLPVPADGDLAVSIFLPKATVAKTLHPLGLQTSYVSTTGDATGANALVESRTIDFWPFLTGVDVSGPGDTAAVITIGDSITDGYTSTKDANHRWPNFLAGRLATSGKGNIAVLNAGISANRILHGEGEDGTNALERFDRDVLAQPNVRYLIVLEGINDIGQPGAGRPDSEAVSSHEIIAGLQQMIARAHEHGIRVYGATLTPFAGTTGNYYTAEKEEKREAVNDWIRTSGAFDAVIDFDKATRNPARPKQFLPAYDSGDHLHPNDAGYKAMGDTIDLSLFQ